MLRAYISAKSARVIVAFLLCGSISGFVLGQELHYPSTAHLPSVVTASAAGSLGAATSTTSRTVKIVNNVRTVPVEHAAPPRSTPPTHPQQAHAQQKHHHGNEENITVSAIPAGQIQAQPHSSNGQGGGGHGHGHD